MNGSAQVSRTVSVLLGIVIVVAVLQLAQDVFVPLALALLLTFLLEPLVDRLQRWRLNRGVAVVLTVALACSLVGGLAYVVVDQFTDVVQQLPRYRTQLRHNLSDLTGFVRGGVGGTQSAVEEIGREISRAARTSSTPTGPVQKVQVVETPANGFEALAAFVEPFVKPVGTVALVIVFVIFMLLRYADLRDRFIRLLGARNLRITTEALDDAAKRVSRYLLMQTLVNSWQGICVATGLYFIGLPSAMLWGALTVGLRFIPYVGPWIAAVMPVALAFAVFDNWLHPLMTIGLFIVVELISNMVLEPWLYGTRTGVSPIALLVAAAFWAWLWGPIGLLLAIPLTVCLVVMGKYIPQLEFLHVLLGDQPVLEPHERLYQRLLASNREEADDLLEEALRTRSPLEVCDSIVLPAMQLAEEDQARGALREAKRHYVLEHIERWSEELLESARSARMKRGEPPIHAEGESSPDPRTVLCLPGNDRADEISARLLAAVLIEQGFAARPLSRAEARRLAQQPEPAVIVVSALPPDAVTHARHLCKRARTLFESVPIFVGIWHARGELLKSRERLEPAGASFLVASFAACVTRLDTGLSGSARSSGPARVHAEPAEDANVEAIPHVRA